MPTDARSFPCLLTSYGFTFIRGNDATFVFIFNISSYIKTPPVVVTYQIIPKCCQGYNSPLAVVSRHMVYQQGSQYNLKQQNSTYYNKPLAALSARKPFPRLTLPRYLLPPACSRGWLHEYRIAAAGSAVFARVRGWDTALTLFVSCTATSIILGFVGSGFGT